MKTSSLIALGAGALTGLTAGCFSDPFSRFWWLIMVIGLGNYVLGRLTEQSDKIPGSD